MWGHAAESSLALKSMGVFEGSEWSCRVRSGSEVKGDGRLGEEELGDAFVCESSQRYKYAGVCGFRLEDGTGVMKIPHTASSSW